MAISFRTTWLACLLWAALMPATAQHRQNLQTTLKQIAVQAGTTAVLGVMGFSVQPSLPYHHPHEYPQHYDCYYNCHRDGCYVPMLHLSLRRRQGGEQAYNPRQQLRQYRQTRQTAQQALANIDYQLAIADTQSTAALVSLREDLLQSIEEADLGIGRQMLALLPDTLGALPTQEARAYMDDHRGRIVRKTYLREGLQARIEIVQDTALAKQITQQYINHPSSQSIRVQGRRALIVPQTDGQWTLHVPIGKYLLSLHVPVHSPTQLRQYAAQIPLSKVAALCQ